MEDRREAVHPLLEQGLDRFRRDVAAGKAGAACGDDDVDAGIGDPGLHLPSDGVDLVGHDRPVGQPMACLA